MKTRDHNQILFSLKMNLASALRSQLPAWVEACLYSDESQERGLSVLLGASGPTIFTHRNNLPRALGGESSLHLWASRNKQSLALDLRLPESQPRRGVSHCTPVMASMIGWLFKKHNRNPKPFIWTANTADFLEKVTSSRPSFIRCIPFESLIPRAGPCLTW